MQTLDVPANQFSDQGGARLRVHVGCEFQYQTAAGVELLLLVEPPAAGTWATADRSERMCSPDVPLRRFVDSFGNRGWRVTAPGGGFTFRYDAFFVMPHRPDDVAPEAPLTPVAELPDDVFQFLLPSRYCQSDLLVDDAWRLLGDSPPGYARVQAVCDWVHANIAYGYGNSGPQVSALETYHGQLGVCRDFAHMAVTFCRALSIPARYVYGYLPDYLVEDPGVPMDFHAWFEAYVGGRWFTFDARHNVPRVGRVKIAQGRDAADVAMITSFGDAQLVQMTVWSDAMPPSQG